MMVPKLFIIVGFMAIMTVIIVVAAWFAVNLTGSGKGDRTAF